MIKWVLKKIFRAVQYVLAKHCLAQHKYDTSSKECWKCGYICEKETHK